MFQDSAPRWPNALVTLEEMIVERAALKAKGIRCVLAIGCFDLLHAGHLDFLHFARAQGDVLIAGVVADAAIRASKGVGRPVVSERDRALLVASLAVVEYAVIHRDKYPASLVKALTPDVFVKGYDWRDCPHGRDIIEIHAGASVVAPGLKRFGEQPEVDALIRKYGYCGTDRVMELWRACPPGGVLRDLTHGTAHLIHGSSEGRFTITYVPGGGLSEAEIRSVHFNCASMAEIEQRYRPDTLKNGFNTLPGGEEVYYIATPSAGLWSTQEKLLGTKTD